MNQPPSTYPAPAPSIAPARGGGFRLAAALLTALALHPMAGHGEEFPAEPPPPGAPAGAAGAGAPGTPGEAENGSPPTPPAVPVAATEELERMREVIQQRRLRGLLSLAEQYRAGLVRLTRVYFDEERFDDAEFAMAEREKVLRDLQRLRRKRVALTSAPPAEGLPPEIELLWIRYAERRSDHIEWVAWAHQSSLLNLRAAYEAKGDAGALRAIQTELEERGLDGEVLLRPGARKPLPPTPPAPPEKAVPAVEPQPPARHETGRPNK